MITYLRASTDEQLREILEIQKRSKKENVSEEEKTSEGYITVGHTFDILKKMNNACPHILAMDKEKVAGYALVMLPSFRNEMEILIPMFETADSLLTGKNYVVMGQVCVDKPYRGMGVFRGMYEFYKKELASTYDCLFTEVATSNTRSIQAHLSLGFEIIHTQITDGTSWEMVNWDWNKKD